jgi:putative membrane protein
MGKILAVGTLLLMTALFGCSKKSSNSGTALNSMDQQFVTSAGYNNVDEINGGYLASTNATDSNVKVFGLQMVNDYGSAQSTLILLADSLGFTVLSSPDQTHAAELSTLQALSGVGFDTAYLRYQINDDQAAITLYEAEQSNSQNAAVKGYVNKYLPVIQSHLSEADSMIKMGHCAPKFSC